MKSTILMSAVILLLAMACDNATNYEDIDSPKYSGEFSNSESLRKDSITVVSYNIQHALRIEQAIEDICSDDVTSNADILLLQEMDPGGVEAIARELEYNYIYYPACRSANYRKDFGNAVLSRWPIKDSRKIILPHKDPRREQKRIAVVATIAITGGDVLACSVHTEFIQTPGKKIDQVQFLADSIDASDKHVIIAGDFNTFLSYTLNSFDKIMDKTGFARATRDIGWTAGVDPLRFPRFNIDHIYTRGFEITESGKSTAASASDHIPIWTILKLKN